MSNQSLSPGSVQEPHRGPQRVGLFWPVVLIGAGVVLLLSNMNYLQGSVWDWLWRLWPILFIAGGLDALVRGEFVGAVMSLGVGGLFLASTFGYYSLNPLEIVLRLWPLFIVSAGLGLVFSRRVVGLAGSLVGALVMAAVLGLAVWLLNGQTVVAEAVQGPRITQALEGATRANVNLEPAFGTLHLKALPEATALVDGVVRLPNGDSPRRSYSVRDGVASYTLRGDNVTFGVIPYNDTAYAWDLGLNPSIPIDLSVRQGAGEMTLDLTGLRLTDLTVNQGVGATTITLPQGTPLHAQMHVAVGTVTLVVPPETGVRVVSNSALFGVSAPGGYTHRGNTYTSPNYNKVANNIDIDVSVAIGSLNVRDQTGR